MMARDAFDRWLRRMTRQHEPASPEQARREEWQAESRSPDTAAMVDTMLRNLK